MLMKKLRRATDFLVTGFIFAMIGVVSGLSLCEYFGGQNATCEVLGHLKIVWVFLLGVLLGVSFLIRNKFAIGLTTIAFAIAAAPVVSLYLPCNSIKTHAKTIHLLQMNL